MKIVVSHLTRMREGNICIAGHEIVEQVEGRAPSLSGKHVRPVIKSRQIGWGMLQIFQLGSIVDLGAVQPQAAPPEVEDVVFSPQNCRQSGGLTPLDFWNMLHFTAHASLREVFGYVLTPYRNTYYVTQGQGHCSLGELRLRSSQVGLFIEPSQHKRRVRLSMMMGRDSLCLPVTDARFYRPPAWEVIEEAVYEMEGMLQSVDSDIILSVGLTRPFAPEGFQIPVHWLQVNNIHVPVDPLWRASLGKHVPVGIDLE